MFNYEFDEIGALLRKSSVNVRQISTRARKRLEEKEPRFAPKTSEAKSLADRFFTACRSGDVSAIESMLTSEAIYTAYLTVRSCCWSFPRMGFVHNLTE